MLPRWFGVVEFLVCNWISLQSNQDAARKRRIWIRDKLDDRKGSNHIIVLFCSVHCGFQIKIGSLKNSHIPLERKFCWGSIHIVLNSIVVFERWVMCVLSRDKQLVLFWERGYLKHLPQILGEALLYDKITKNAKKCWRFWVAPEKWKIRTDTRNFWNSP